MNRMIFTNRYGKMLMLLMVSVLCSCLSGDEKRRANDADRYRDAYLKYQDASVPLQEDNICHYVYFAGDREKVRNHPFLFIKRFEGAQIMYRWRNLEPEEGVYDFSNIREDDDYLLGYGKKLFIQLQDATFSSKRQPVPDYLLAEKYDGGAVQQREDGNNVGWVAKRWNREVQHRFALLLQALGQAFDGKIAGINLQESSIGVSKEFDQSFSPELYARSLKVNMSALKQAFPTSITMQYANFMPGEWLPWEDHGYLRSLYQHGQEIGVGLGAPDLMVKTRGQLNHALAMMHEIELTVPVGIAVQDGNYIGKTGSDEILKDRENIVPLLHAFAKDFLNVNYMFWSAQEPYFTEDVIPCFSGERTPSLVQE